MSEVETNTGFSQVIEYSVTDAAIAELRQKYQGVTDYPVVLEGVKELTRLRNDVERKRRDLKADALDWGRKVDGEAKRITDLLAEIEAPLKAIKKTVDDEKKRIELEKAEQEAARVESIKQKIEGFKNCVFKASMASVTEIKTLLDEIQGLIKNDPFNYAEFSIQADIAKNEAAKNLTALYEGKLAQEREQKRLAEEAEKSRIAQEEERRKFREEAARQKQEQEDKQREIEVREKELAEREAKLKKQEAPVQIVKTPQEPVNSSLNDASNPIDKTTHEGQAEETITILKSEYEKLKEDQIFLDCLQCSGVDNWEGYGEAVDIFDEQMRNNK